MRMNERWLVMVMMLMMMMIIKTTIIGCEREDIDMIIPRNNNTF